MSTLNLTTLKTVNISNAGETKTITADNVIDGSAKAWVNFNASGVIAIRASFNVSSITDNGTGSFTINLSSAMPDANGAVNVSFGSIGAVGRFVGYNFTSATAVLMVTQDSAGATVDYVNNSITVFR
jgi:hypothetical protein